MEEELGQEILDNYGLPRPETPMGRDVAPASVEFSTSEVVNGIMNQVYNNTGIRPEDLMSTDSIEVNHEIGDEDYVIDVETAPTYNGLTRQQFEATVEQLAEVSEEEIEQLAPVEEVSPEEENTPFELDAEEQELINLLLEDVQVTIEPIIEPNTEVSIISQTTSRFSGAEWYEQIQKEQVILAGVGGIGSYVGFLLGRLNVDRLTIFDDDTVDVVNMSGQLYSMSNIGAPKVDALASMLTDYANYYKVSAHRRKFIESSHATPVMICGFDNMEARKIFFYSWWRFVLNCPEERRKDCLFIDGRLAAEEYQVLCLRGDDEYSINKYKDEFLFTDEQADATLCSYKQTSFMANQIASTMVNLFVNFVANKCNPLIERYLPFYTEYNAETMFFKTIS